VNCVRCDRPFPEYRNKRFCSDACRSVFNHTGRKKVDYQHGLPWCVDGNRCGNCLKDRMREHALQRWARGIFPGTVRSDAWTLDEIEFVERRAGHIPMQQIEAELRESGISPRPRSIYAIRNALHERGVSWSATAYRTSEVAAFLGIDQCTAQALIARGYLKADRRTRETNAYWRIKPEALNEFLRAYPWMYDMRALDKRHAAYIVAVAANRGEQWLTAKQLATLLGRYRSRVRQLAADGVFKAERRWREWMFRASLLPEYRAALQDMQERQLERLRANAFKPKGIAA